jgi:uncharacterized cupredoxin-like copper-binding protein
MVKSQILAGALAAGLVVLGCNRSTTVHVEMRDGQIEVHPASVPEANHIIFNVANGGKTRHHFVAVRTVFTPSALPVENGRVRKYTFPGEPDMTFYGDEGGWGLGGSPDHAPDPEDLQEALEEGDVGVMVSPGEIKAFTKVGQRDDTFDRGTAFVLYCDEPGHYEHGEHTGLMVE